MTNILIPNPQAFNEKLQSIIAWWSEHFHVIADFDRTLTKAFVDGKPRSSLESILEQEGYLGEEYSKNSLNNFNTYHPIEIDPAVSLEDKKKAMMQRWTKQFTLMLEVGITRDVIKKTVQSNLVNFREWYETFFDMLKDNNIPLLIFSATGLWYEAIYFCLENVKKLSDNIDIISNAFIRDEHGKAIAVREPIVHSFNKGETIVRDLPIYDDIKDRKNILLLGDGLWDTHMANWLNHEHILKIWFLNNDTPENREKFFEAFDLLILDDGPMDEVNEILKKILAG